MKKNKKIFLLICFIILCIAALPRAIELINGNYVFGFDQGKHWLAAKSIIIDHKFPLIGDEVGGQGGFFQGSGWYFMLALPFVLFRGDPYGAIVLLFFVSLGMVLLYLSLFYTRIGKKETLAGGLFLSMAPILISNTRLVWPPFIIPFLTVLYLWFSYRILEGNYAQVFFLFFIIGVMAHFEIATAGTLCIATGILFALWSIKKKIPITYMGLGFIGFILPLIPLIIFDLRHDLLNLKGILATLQGTKRYVGSWQEYVKIIANHWMIFSDEFFRAFQTKFIPKILIAVLVIVGSASMLSDKKILHTKKLFVGFLCVLPIMLFFVFLGYKNNMWAWWISELTVVYTVLAGILYVYAWSKGPAIRIMCVVIVCFITASYVTTTVNSYKHEIGDYGGVHKIKGKKDAIDVIYKDAGGEQFTIMIFTPPVYTYPYDYLFSWYGNKQYGYIPPSGKKDLFYLLIEPDPEKPWSHNGWIETVVKEGAIEKTWNLPSGFVIEKRRLIP